MDYSLVDLRRACAAGIGPGSPASWDGYPSIPSRVQDVLHTVLTPAAYRSVLYQPNTFKRIYELPGMAFDQLEIFRRQNGEFTAQKSKKERSPYRSIFHKGQELVRDNHRNALRNIIAGTTDDVSVFVNMAFISKSYTEWTEGLKVCLEKTDPRYRRVVLKGYFPYASNLSTELGEIMFFFAYAPTDRLALVTVPTDERAAAVDFIIKNGAMQLFDKVCAQCGKTGGGGELDKCPCKTVRYCCVECYREHWPLHKADCEWYAAKQLEGAA